MAEVMPYYYFWTKKADDFIGEGNKYYLMETNKSGTMLLIMVFRMIF